jgi:CBS domain-containing protein
MRLGNVMTRNVELVSPDATVKEAATTMAEFDVGAVLVGTQEQLEGILTDRDIILRAVIDGRDTNSLLVREVMSSTLFSCHEEDTVETALRTMKEHQVRRLPVLDRDERLAGIVTLSDIWRLEHGEQ